MALYKARDSIFMKIFKTTLKKTLVVPEARAAPSAHLRTLLANSMPSQGAAAACDVLPEETKFNALLS